MNAAATTLTASGVDRPGRDTRRLDLALGALVVVLIAISVLAIGSGFAIRSAAVELITNTLTGLAAAGAAFLAWVRVRETREDAAIFEAAAFLVLLGTRFVLVLVAAIGAAGPLGMSVDSPQQWPIYAWTLARALTATLLVLAATDRLRTRTARSLPRGLMVVLPVALMAAAMALLPGLEPRLPLILSPDRLEAAGAAAGSPRGMEAFGVAAQLGIAGLYVIGAVLNRRRYRDGTRIFAGYLAIALVVAAFSQLHWAIVPGLYTPVVTADEFLNAAFALIVLAGIQAQSRADFRDLRAANQRLEELRSVEVERAALTTRAELAREVHDGLAQELWFAKLKAGRLAQQPGLEGDTRELAVEVGDAVDRALADARTALVSIRAGLDGEPDLAVAIEDYVEAFGERTGLATTFTADPPLPTLPSRSAAEVLRILLEALGNVEKHADATSITVSARADGGGLEISVADNGRGFDPGTTGGTRYGIRGMQERAVQIGGRVEITSEPGNGTRVVVRVPLAAAGT
jgi:signal transduction histidine kinase